MKRIRRENAFFEFILILPRYNEEENALIWCSYRMQEIKKQ